jgi:hypothetical protein
VYYDNVCQNDSARSHPGSPVNPGSVAALPTFNNTEPPPGERKILYRDGLPIDILT